MVGLHLVEVIGWIRRKCGLVPWSVSLCVAFEVSGAHDIPFDSPCLGPVNQMYTISSCSSHACLTTYCHAHCHDSHELEHCGTIIPQIKCLYLSAASVMVFCQRNVSVTKTCVCRYMPTCVWSPEADIRSGSGHLFFFLRLDHSKNVNLING